MTILMLILHALWFIAPAYAANGFPPLLRGKRPLDKNKMLKGNRILGDGKTWEGTIGGILFGLFIGSLQVTFQGELACLGLDLPTMTFPLVFALCLGTMAGDILGSFAKRRLGMKRGDSALLLDQDGFVIMAFFFAILVYKIDYLTFLILLIITPPVHWFFNLIGYWLKFKKTPW